MFMVSMNVDEIINCSVTTTYVYYITQLIETFHFWDFFFYIILWVFLSVQKYLIYNYLISI